MSHKNKTELIDFYYKQIFGDKNPKEEALRNYAITIIGYTNYGNESKEEKQAKEIYKLLVGKELE
jgi:hypothetical protein